MSLSRRLPLDEHLTVLQLLCPDLGVFAVSLVTVILCNKLVKNRETVSAANITSVSQLLLGSCLASGWLVLVSGWLMLNADEGRSQKVPLHCSTLPIWSLWKRNGMEASPQRARESPSAKKPPLTAGNKIIIITLSQDNVRKRLNVQFNCLTFSRTVSFKYTWHL